MKKSSQGERVPELAGLLRKIAEQVKQWEDRDVGEQVESDAERVSRPAYFLNLERLAKAFEDGTLRYHRKPGGQHKGIAGLDEKIAHAESVKSRMDEHAESINNAALELADDRDKRKAETIRKAAQEILPILALPDGKRNFLLAFKRLEATGRAKVKRIPSR